MLVGVGRSVHSLNRTFVEEVGGRFGVSTVTYFVLVTGSQEGFADWVSLVFPLFY